MMLLEDIKLDYEESVKNDHKLFGAETSGRTKKNRVEEIQGKHQEAQDTTDKRY